MAHHHREGMKPKLSDEELGASEQASGKPSRADEIRQLIEAYANDLRKILEKLRRRLN